MIKKKESLFLAGLFCIFISMILNLGFEGFGLIAFVKGVFLGMSFVFNISYLALIRLAGLI